MTNTLDNEKRISAIQYILESEGPYQRVLREGESGHLILVGDEVLKQELEQLQKRKYTGVPQSQVNNRR